MAQQFELLFCIVNSGQGTKTLSCAKKYGIKGGTICMGKGVIQNKFLEFFDIQDSRKELVLMVAEKELAFTALNAISKAMHFNKPYHGIGFAISLSNFIGTKHLHYYDDLDNKAVNDIMFNAIFTVVEKGHWEEVLESASQAGSTGGTIINARGSSLNEACKLFAMPIEPEKEIVLVIAKKELTKAICNSIRENLKIDEPGHGIIFVVDLDAAYGLY